jgi:ribosomal protein S18 acetylase RimI-like enzyme
LALAYNVASEKAIDMKSGSKRPNRTQGNGATVPAGAKMDIRVAEAEAADLAEIIALDGQVTGFKRADFWTDLFRRRRTSETLSILVARSADKIIGYALGEIRSWPVRAPACGWLYAIGVDKEYRLHKAASALLTELIARFRRRGVAAIRTMIDVDDHLLMSFLRGFGMTAGPFLELELTFEAD